MKKLTIAMIIILGVLAVVQLDDISDHEYVHQRTFEVFGIEANVTSNLFAGATTPTTWPNMTEAKYMMLVQTQMFNEAVNYNTTCIKFLLMFVVFLLSFIVASKLFGDEEFNERRYEENDME